MQGKVQGLDQEEEGGCRNCYDIEFFNTVAVTECISSDIGIGQLLKVIIDDT